MEGSVDQHQAGVPPLESRHGARSPMSRTIIHDPEDAPGLIVRGPGHDLIHQPIKRSNPILRLAATEHPGVVDIEGSQVSPGTATLVFMLDPHRAMGLASA